MRAFHNDEKIKQKYLARVIAHQKADNLIRGQGWNGTKGCAVGCTLENYDHSRYPIELGIPEWLARVEDTLFEGMTLEKSKTWPEVFLRAVNVGANLEKIKTPFIVYILKQTIKSMDACEFDRSANPNVVEAVDRSKAAVLEMIRCHEKGLDLSAAESAAWSAAASAAASAESAARSAAWLAAWSAESAAWSAAASAAASAESAAASAAASAASAESAARSAAWSAARSAASAAWLAAWSAESAAWSAAHDNYAEELIRMIENCDGELG